MPTPSPIIAAMVGAALETSIALASSVMPPRPVATATRASAIGISAATTHPTQTPTATPPAPGLPRWLHRVGDRGEGVGAELRRRHVEGDRGNADAPVGRHRPGGERIGPRGHVLHARDPGDRRGARV